MSLTALRRIARLLAVLLALSLVAAACGSDDDDPPASEDAADTTSSDSTADEPAADEPAADEPEELDLGRLPDLGGRTVTVGVENAYLPFNYVSVGSDAG